MPEQIHPESIPDSSPLPSSFVFSLDVGKEQRVNVEDQISQLESKVDQIIRTTDPGGDYNILFPIVKVCGNDIEALKAVHTSIGKLIPILEELNKLKLWQGAFALAETQPEFYRWAFGDFSQDLDVLSETTTPIDPAATVKPNKVSSPEAPQRRSPAL